MIEARKKAIRDIVIYLSLMWVGYILSIFLPLNDFGLIPRDLGGLIGLVTAPFLHGGFFHIFFNTIGFLIFGLIYVMLEGEDLHFPFWYIAIVGGALTWLFARSGVHIGASGVIFGLYGYLMSIGYISGKIKYIAASFFVMITYGWMIIGVFPSLFSSTSFEGHLFGLLAGISLARIRKFVDNYEEKSNG